LNPGMESMDARGLDITPAAESDIPLLARLLAESDFWRRKRLGYEEAVRFFATYNLASRGIYLARDGDEVAGFIWFTTSGTFHEFGYIRLIVVDSGHQGRGLGTRLMKFAEERILAESKAVFLLVSDFNQGARKLYERLGYAPCGRLKNYKGLGNDEIIMWKAAWSGWRSPEGSAGTG